MNVFHPSLEYMAANAGAYAGVWRWRETRKLGETGFVVYSDASRYNTVEQRLEELAYLYPSDIAALLAESGFELLRVSGDFLGRPFERDGDELVIEARKP